jgi:preprotein translocase subunit SecF
LFIGGAILGTGTLNDLSLVLFVGMLSGTYSSIFIATPVLADLKEREPQYKELAIRVKRRNAGGRAAQRAAAAATVTTPAGATTATATTVRADTGTAGTAGMDLADPPQQDETPDTGADEVTVPATQSAGTPARRGTDGARPVSRQQPRRGGSAQRRTGPRKKRR